MKTHLLQIATVEEHNIVYKNVYGNDIESYINNLISFVESDSFRTVSFQKVVKRINKIIM